LGLIGARLSCTPGALHGLPHVGVNGRLLGEGVGYDVFQVL
jgi:hypothetical protein